MTSKPTGTVRRAGKWAPWWTYLVPILGINYLRQLVLPYGTVPEAVDALLAVVTSVMLFVIMTVIYRATRRG